MSKRYPGGIIRKTPQTPSQTSAQGIWDMASVTQAVKENTWPIAGVPDPISRSLRFRSSASAQLTRTVPGVNTTQLTFSCWFKSSVNSTDNVLYSTANNSSNYLYIGLNSSNVLDVQIGATANRRVTTQVFRDPSAWYHLVVTFDSTQSTASDRIKVYVNGSQVTAFSTNTTGMSQNANLPSISSTLTNYIGGYNGSAGFYFDGYMTEIYMVYGQALTPSSFGTTDDQTGVWEPIAYTGTYGTNGFYLPFSNTASTATLGNDFSGNSNNWTTNNISLTSGTTYDSMVDVPTQWIPYNTAGDTGALYRGNYCVLNPLDTGSNITLSNANLTMSQTANAGISKGTIAVSSGKWYWEFVVTSGTDECVGIASINTSPTIVYLGFSADSYSYFGGGGIGRRYNNGTSVNYGASWTTNDVIGVALDMDVGTLVFYKNGVSQGTAYSGLSGTFVPACGNNATHTTQANFGQRPFAYAPPSGFVTLNTRNLPTPTIGTTSTTQANDYFNAILYTGNGSTQTVTGLDFTPGMLWIKDRTSVTNHQVNDQVRGVGRELQPDSTSAETNNNIVTAFNSNGFSLSSNGNVNANGNAYVAWTWRAAGSGVTNTDGTITATVSANTSAGFSIVTGTTLASGTLSYGHGLGVTPAMVIYKSRATAGQNWWVWHQSLPNAATGRALQLNTTSAEVAGAYFGTPAVSSSIVTLAAAALNSDSFVSYVFAQIAGYSAFGSYTGNGSTDGPFVYTGFRPKYWLIKRTDSSDSWVTDNSVTSPYNLTSKYLLPNTADAEGDTGSNPAGQAMDVLSNGFKLRNTNSGRNASGGTYIYMAFAEFPFKFSLAR